MDGELADAEKLLVLDPATDKALALWGRWPTVAEQRVTDEQLTEWDEDTRHAVHVYGSSRSYERVLDLIAEVRASRAREAELTAEVETWQGRCSADQDNMTRFRRRAIAAEAERDVLQQRLDNALAWCVKANPSPESNGDQFAELRAALTGTEPE